MGKKYLGGFLNLFLLILIALAIVGLIIFAFIKKGGFSPQPDSEEQSSEIPTEWPLYKNPVYLYQIRYHPDFHVQGDNEPPYPPPPAGMSFTKKWDNGEHCDFLILTTLDDNAGEIESLRQGGSDVEHQTTVSGIDAIYFDHQGGEAIDRSYYLDHKGIYYRFGYNYRPAAKYSQDCADIVSKMVASFEITEE